MIYTLFQKYGVNNKHTVNNSSLPISINKDNTHLLKSEMCAKEADGPTDPIPGPTFPNAEAAALIEVKKSNPVTVSISDPTVNIKR
jgi:hypothetical protein